MKYLKLFLLAAAAIGLTLFFSPGQAQAGKYRRTSGAYSHYLMALIHEYSDDLKSAVDEYKKAGLLDYYSLLVHSKLATNYIRLGELEKAVSELKNIIRLEPENLEAHFVLALIYAAQKRHNDAVREYELILKKVQGLEPENTEIRRSLAQLYFEERRLDEAVQQFQKILAVSPGDSASHFYLGVIYEEKGQHSLAIDELKKAIAINPKDANALNSLGYIYALRQENLDDAEALVKQALGLDPDNGAYLDSLGWVYFKKGRLDEALTQLEKAAKLYSDPVIHDHLAEAYLQKGLTDQARQEWQKALSLDPKQNQIKEKLESLRKESLMTNDKIQNPILR